MGKTEGSPGLKILLHDRPDRPLGGVRNEQNDDGSAADGFRQEVIAYLWAANRRGEKIDYRSYEPLKEAIEKKLITSVRDLSRVITKSRMRDEEQSEKYDAMVKTLLDHGYCPSCVDMVLKYAANNLWKD